MTDHECWQHWTEDEEIALYTTSELAEKEIPNLIEKEVKKHQDQIDYILSISGHKDPDLNKAISIYEKRIKMVRENKYAEDMSLFNIETVEVIDK
jgi:hypothetical protein